MVVLNSDVNVYQRVQSFSPFFGMTIHESNAAMLFWGYQAELTRTAMCRFLVVPAEILHSMPLGLAADMNLLDELW